MKKIILISVICLLLRGLAVAQNKNIYLGLGCSPYFNTAIGNSHISMPNIMLGGRIVVLPVNDELFLSFGGELSVAQSVWNMDNIITTRRDYDYANNVEYELRTYYDGFAERQTVWNIGIPATLNWNTPVDGLGFHVGAVINAPLFAGYCLTSGTYRLRYYDVNTNQEEYNLPDHGYGDYVMNKERGSWNPRMINVSGVLDISYSISENVSFGIEGRISYPIVKESEADIIQVYDGYQVYNGLLNSNLAKVIMPWSVSGKLIWTFKGRQGNQPEDHYKSMYDSINNDYTLLKQNYATEIASLQQQISDLETRLRACESIEYDTVNNNDKVIGQYIWLVLSVPYSENRCQRADERYRLASDRWQRDKNSQLSREAIKNYRDYNNRLIKLLEELKAAPEATSNRNSVRNEYLQFICSRKINDLKKSFEKEGFNADCYEFLFKVMNQILYGIEQTKTNSSYWVDFDSYIKMLKNEY